jgi:serine protease
MSRPSNQTRTFVSLGLTALLSVSAAISIITVPPKPAQPAPAQALAAPPTDPIYPQQWNLAQIHIQDAWAIKSGAPVMVAVLDTGYAQSAELNSAGSSREINGYDFVSDPARSGDGDGRDPDATAVGPLAYHGEVVANLIAAARDGRGVVGVNPLAQILHLRVGGSDGLIDAQDLADAMRWGAGLPVPGLPLNSNPARIENLSLYADFIPLTGCDARVKAAIQAVTARGVLVVVGAANDGADASGYTPAGCSGVLSVTSVNRSGQRPDYANWGKTVALAAPGGSRGDDLPLWSRGELTLKNGTSFAAPQVAGVASLMLGVNPALTPAALISMLKASATPFAGGHCDPVNLRYTCGAGILNAGAALRLASRK